jgi:hypothetical protein
MVAYCNRKGLDQDSVVFFYEESQVSRDATPQQLGMQDGDRIVVVHNVV